MSDMQTNRRDKGEGSTRLRKDGRYEYRYVAGKKIRRKGTIQVFYC